MTRTDVRVIHVRLTTTRDFETVVQALEASVPAVEPRLAEMLIAGDQDAIERQRRTGPPLWIFERRDHGQLLAAEGRKSGAYQYEIGNPLTAELMTRRVLAAALYAPLRVVLYEDADGGAVAEYDLPSSQFGQFGDGEVADVGRRLDDEIETALRQALFGMP